MQISPFELALDHLDFLREHTFMIKIEIICVIGLDLAFSGLQSSVSGIPM